MALIHHSCGPDCHICTCMDAELAQLREKLDEAERQLAEGLAVIHDNGLAANSTNLEDAVRQVVQVAIMESANSKMAVAKLAEARKDTERLDWLETWTVAKEPHAE